MSGGSGGGGGGIVQRAVRAGAGGAAQKPFSHSTTTPITKPTYYNKPDTSNTLSISSSTTASPFPSFNLPISAISTAPICPSHTYTDEFEWELVDGGEYERAYGFYNDIVFGSVPSADEVQYAVSALQQVSSAGSELDWIEPSLHLCNSRMLQPHGSEIVYDAFHLLQTEPSIQRMVISLSSDKAVWAAVLDNEVVRELRESLTEAENNVSGGSDESCYGSNGVANILSWVVVNTKAKIMELIKKITKLVNELFQPPDSNKTTTRRGATDPSEDKLITSFLLSIMVMLIVVVTRANRA